MKPIHYQALRVLACIAALALVSMGSNLWWIGVAPWALLCLVGIIMSTPVAVLFTIGASAAGANLTNDRFITAFAFVVPTVIAVAISEVLRRRRLRAC